MKEGTNVREAMQQTCAVVPPVTTVFAELLQAGDGAACSGAEGGSEGGMFRTWRDASQT